ncbi:hypothetical protein D3C85_816440 [compost metagenome]
MCGRLKYRNRLTLDRRLGRRGDHRLARRCGLGNRHGLDCASQLVSQLLQQLALRTYLLGHRAAVFGLQAHNSAASLRPGCIEQAPLRFEYRRLLHARIQPTDVQHDLNLSGETDAIGIQRDAAGIELPGQLAQQQLTDIVLQTAGPAGLLAEREAVVELTLHQVLAQQVVRQLQRAEQ